MALGLLGAVVVVVLITLGGLWVWDNVQIKPRQNKE